MDVYVRLLHTNALLFQIESGWSDEVVVRLVSKSNSSCFQVKSVKCLFDKNVILFPVSSTSSVTTGDEDYLLSMKPSLDME